MNLQINDNINNKENGKVGEKLELWEGRDKHESLWLDHNTYKCFWIRMIILTIKILADTFIQGYKKY